MDPIIKQAPQEFKANGYKFKVIESKGNIILYSQHSQARDEIVGYEVHKIRISPIPSFLMSDANYIGFTHYERLARNKDCGMYGWSYHNYENARKRFVALTLGKDKYNDE